MPSIQEIHQHIDHMLQHCPANNPIQMKDKDGNRAKFIDYALENGEITIRYRSIDLDVLELYVTELSAPKNIIEPNALRGRDMNDEPFDLYC